MELSKQQKAIDRKFAYNTGKLPGFSGGGIGGGAAGTVAGLFGNYIQNNYGQQHKIPEISNPQHPKYITPTNQSQPRLEIQKPTTVNGITTNAGTGYKSDGPTQSDQAAAGIHPGFAIGAWLGGGVLEGLGQIKSADEHLAEAGTSTANINGINYTQQNSVDANKIMSNYNQSTATDFLTNPARAITKLFGSSKARREAYNAATYANIQQAGARDNAYAQYLKLDNAKKYGNMEDQALYAADGKLPKYKEGLVNGEANAKVSNGEFIAREVIPGQFIGYRVPGPKNNKDGRLAHLEPEDYVISNKNGSSDIAASGDIIGAINHMITTGNPSYKCGKLPGHKEGWLGNFIPSALGSLASIDQMLMAYKNKPYRPNTYVDNPYETEALSTLAGLRINPYPIITQLRDAEFRSNRAVDIAGGLSGSQRNAARLANLNTTQKNISNLLSSIQQQNNAYRANYAQAALNAGQASRTARMDANRWDLDYYSKAHAARNKGIQTGIANMLSQIQQYQANEFKRRQFNDTMSLYRADQKQRKDQLNWYKDNAAKLANMGTTFNIPSLYGNRPLFYQDENGNYVRIS